MPSRATDEGPLPAGRRGLPDAASGYAAGRWQFGLGSLLSFVTLCAVALSFYRSLGPGLVAFIIMFAALMLLVLRMMTHRPPGSLAVIDVDSDAAAQTCRELLRRNGIAAEVVIERAVQAFQLAYCSPQIVVPADEAGRARELIAELVAGQTGPGSGSG